MKKLLLGVSLLVTASLLNASVVKEMGFVSVKYPQIKNVQDMNLLIDDVVEFIYDAFGDAMLKAIKNHRQRQTVHFKDIVYMGETLLPKRADEASIEKFYKAIDTTSLSEIAKQNGVSHILFAKFDEDLLNKALEKNGKKIQVPLNIYMYDAKDNKLLQESIEVVLDREALGFDLETLSLKTVKAVDKLFDKL